jgi:hypothetical protein
MDREYCLSFLIALVGGTTLLACGWWPVVDVRIRSARGLEKITWWRIWVPVAPALAVASALCGWAWLEPDPVPEGVPISLILMSMPFALLLARAAVRGGWALITDPGDPGTATVGLLPWIVFSPRLAKKLDDRQIGCGTRTRTGPRAPLGPASHLACATRNGPAMAMAAGTRTDATMADRSRTCP